MRHRSLQPRNIVQQRGDHDKAIAQYKKILAARPAYPDIFLRLAECEASAGRRAEAIGWAQKELAVHPKRPDAWCALGNLYLAAGDLKHATSAFKSLIALEEMVNGERLAFKRDAYANVTLAWIQIQLAHSVSGWPRP